MRPDFIEVSVEPVKLVAALNMDPYKFTSVILQFVNTDPVKSVEVKSIDVNVAPVTLDPLPITVIVISATVTASKFGVAPILDVIVVVPIPRTVAVPVFAAVVTVATPVLSEECVSV